MRRSYWGWGYEDAALEPGQRQRLKMLLSTQLDLASLQPLEPKPLASLQLPATRIVAPASLQAKLSTAPADRAAHTYGKSFRDLIRGLRGDFGVAPDAVAYPRSEADVVALLDWCSSAGIAAIAFGGGSSVVGGVEGRCRDAYPAVVSIDLRQLCGVRDIDLTSRAALIGAGTFGPAIEQALKPHGMTLRHFPQSFEFSTLGGWSATRAGGHFATLHTHIDDLLEAMTVVTPSGMVETRRLPASGAGPSPDRMFVGSEGALGIIVRAWMRLQQRPTHRGSASVRFDDFYTAADALRLLAQSGLYPSNCRLLGPIEALINGVGDGSSSFVLVAFESADHPVAPWLDRAVDIARGQGGVVVDADDLKRAVMPSADIIGGEDGGAAARWRKMFLRAPYMRDAMVQMGVVVETFETAMTWDRFAEFHREVMATARDAVARICGAGLVSSRVTHVYPDGAAPYFTVIAAGKPNGQLEQWDEIKAAVSEVIIDAGGTITHHHAVGRDHRPFYDRQRPELFAAALTAAKGALDPAGILNPGVLVD